MGLLGETQQPIHPSRSEGAHDFGASYCRRSEFSQLKRGQDGISAGAVVCKYNANGDVAGRRHIPVFH